MNTFRFEVYESAPSVLIAFNPAAILLFQMQREALAITSPYINADSTHLVIVRSFCTYLSNNNLRAKVAVIKLSILRPSSDANPSCFLFPSGLFRRKSTWQKWLLQRAPSQKFLCISALRLLLLVDALVSSAHLNEALHDTARVCKLSNHLTFGKCHPARGCSWELYATSHFSPASTPSKLWIMKPYWL